MEDKFNFKGGDPGAVKLGNFINYYSFHSPANRMESLPSHLWKTTALADFVCLDIGCNSGDLTEEVFQFISQNLTANDTTDHLELSGKCFFLALDIDPTLIQRAVEKSNYPQNIEYVSADIMEFQTDVQLKHFLSKHHKRQFDVTFCFSVSMWIHLNHGDKGLQSFLKNICENSRMVVIEPQPWKCYKSAIKRLKRHHESLPHFEKLTWRENVDSDIESYLYETCGLVKVYETPESTWGRRIIFVQHTMS